MQWHILVLFRQDTDFCFVLSKRPKKLHLLIAFFISEHWKTTTLWLKVWFIFIHYIIYMFYMFINTQTKFLSSAKIVIVEIKDRKIKILIQLNQFKIRSWYSHLVCIQIKRDMYIFFRSISFLIIMQSMKNKETEIKKNPNKSK